MENGPIEHFVPVFRSNMHRTLWYTTMAGAIPEKDSSSIGNTRKAVVGSTANICATAIGSLA
jgi:hypothetical protein